MDSRPPLPCCEVHGGPWVGLGCLPSLFPPSVSRILPVLQGAVRSSPVVMLAGISREAPSESHRATVNTHVLIPSLLQARARGDENKPCVDINALCVWLRKCKCLPVLCVLSEMISTFSFDLEAN